ncbi:hypothetical protein NLI96_g13157 [Meripilus lineatus]|uniref:Helitron helicase-like domain-containing protein n=1 Tax=Meripilus lineatus TaxID=2056292 RepID=A0AAD5YBR0_9APHY|nr:hypothetical protein NLI96_g13157 [Physisporinus lineatus]
MYPQNGSTLCPINDTPPSFPPEVLPISERIEIIREWTEHVNTKIEEGIWAPAKDYLILCSAAIENGEAKLCDLCLKNLSCKNMPQIALANSLVLGEVPPELKDLSFVEKLVIAKYRHFISVIRVAKSGQRKLAGNAIVFAQPVPKFYDILPPPRDDLDDCLSVLFTGTIRLSQWFSDRRNLVLVTYRQRTYPFMQRLQKGGTDDGECSFAVSGLTGEELNNMTEQEKKLFALKALNASDPCVAYGRSAEPESIFNNPNLYPGMFPWLFPYGTGGYKNSLMQKQLGRRAHTRWLLLYHDRRFATDQYFPFIIFNHDQISAAVRGGYVVTEKRMFDDVVERILDLDPVVVDTLIKKGQQTGYIIAETEEEKKCCRILPLIEYASAGVDASITQRKYQRNEIKAVSYEKGLPLFFITFSPVDFKNPICLHYCGRDFSIAPLGPASEPSGDCLRAIASNPVACARFFDEMVRMFIDIVLRDGRNKDGLFGRTSGYYGTVESRRIALLLHLHMLLWIENSDSPQEIRDQGPLRKKGQRKGI